MNEMALNIISWNCAGGIKNKMDEVKRILFSSNADFLFISEAEVSEKILSFLNIQGYELVLAPMHEKRSRIACYIKSSHMHEFKQRVDLESPREDVIVLESDSLRIIGVYRGFMNPFPNYDQLDMFFSLLSRSCNISKKLLVVGDFNIDPNRDSHTRAGRRLDEWAIDHDLIQMVGTVTRRRVVVRNEVATLQESMIDLSFSNRPNEADTLVFQSDFSDHDFIWTKIKYGVTKKKAIKRVIRDWTHLNETNIMREALEGPVPNSLEMLNEIHLKILDKLAPFRVAKIRSPEQIVNPKVEKIRKKKDRAYKKYKRTGLSLHLFMAKHLENELKKLVKSETRRVFQVKATAPGNKSFWNAVNDLQGYKRFDDLSLTQNGVSITNDLALAEIVGDFFKNKVSKLSDGLPPVLDVPNLPAEDIDFSLDEVTDAIKKAKTKMSSGPDGIPLKLVKYYGLARPELYRELFNGIANNKFPDQWRTARVVAIHKKGDKKDVSNYRPVSNLCSLSKIYERCILKRLNDCATHLLGSSQHGFRSSHSTTTCLVEIKDSLLNSLDNDQVCVMYSLDLSAAFDMLRKDTFVHNMLGEIPNSLLNVISDFLSNRSFYVNVKDANSSLYSLDRGCPQGSVLGPVLFNLYVGRIHSYLPPDARFIAYADDSYVICPGASIADAQSLAESTIAIHVEKLKELGMVVNESKTEVTVFSKVSEPILIDMACGDKIIQSKPIIKALGVIIDHRLRWTEHIKAVVSKVRRLICGFRMIRDKFTEIQAKNLVTAQALSVLYYGSAAWLTPSLLGDRLRRLESIHYRCLRVIVKGYKQRISREWIDAATQRLPPKIWCRFAAASLAIKVRQTKEPKHLYDDFFLNT